MVDSHGDASVLDRLYLLADDGATHLYLVRHAQAVFTGDDYLSGEADTPLTDLGVRQAEAVCGLLSREPVTAIYSSTMLRALQTAQPLARALKLPVIADSALREFNPRLDVVEGEDAAAVREQIVARFRAMAEGGELSAAPPVLGSGSGAGAVMRQRAVQALDRLVERHPGGHVAVFTHGGVIISLLYHLLGATEPMRFLPVNGSVTQVLAKGDRRVLFTANELAHLPAITGA